MGLLKKKRDDTSTQFEAMKDRLLKESALWEQERLTREARERLYSSNSSSDPWGTYPLPFGSDFHWKTWRQAYRDQMILDRREKRVGDATFPTLVLTYREKMTEVVWFEGEDLADALERLAQALRG